MNGPMMVQPREITRDTYALVSYMPLPGLGVLPINSFFIRAQRPVLIDTGIAGLRQDFLHNLQTLIDPRELSWIWLTHTDADHVGNLSAVLELAPHARVVTTFLGMGKLGLLGLPLDRVFLLNPGQSLDAGDRQLIALRPPCFDAPETTAALDTRHRTLFSSDCFGALLEEPAETAADLSAAALREGMTTWATIDAPWLRMLDSSAFHTAIDEIRRLQPEMILSSHLPAAEALHERLYQNLFDARTASAFVGPDQSALLQMMSV